MPTTDAESGPPDPAGKKQFRRGWTTGACATAAARASVEALWTGRFPDPVVVTLPSGAKPRFALAQYESGPGFARAGVVKDAGDDPDVTHGALIVAEVRPGVAGSGVTFRAGPGVGMVTRPGLPLAVGEPAINPVPRAMITAAVFEAADLCGARPDVVVTVSIPGGEEIAKRTLNGRLGIVGGLSILGTTGIVIPYSCAAWIDSIHRGIDVARACGMTHIAASTGSTSEAAVAKLDGLEPAALIEMGDFVGGLLKYVRSHPVPHLTIAGGFAKMTKLAQGRLDLHSKRGEVDLGLLASLAREAGAGADVAACISGANSAMEALGIARAAGVDVAGRVAERALATAARVIVGSGVALDVAVFDREGGLLARTEPGRM